MPITYEDLSGEAVWSRTDNFRTGGAGGRYLDIAHKDKLEQPTGTLALSFSADRTPGQMALISKDSYGNESGGGFTLWLIDGTLQLTMETATGTEWLSVPNLSVSAGETHHVAITFGPEGLELWLDGALIAVETDFVTGIAANDNTLVLGGTRAWGDDDDAPGSLFQGVIGDVMLFDRQLNEEDLLTLTEEASEETGHHAREEAMMADLMPVFGQMHHASDALKDIAEHAGFYSDGHAGNEHGHGHIPDLVFQNGTRGDNTLTGTAGADGMNGGLGNDMLDGQDGNDVLQGSYGNDSVYGGDGNDVIDGGHGEDTLKGGAGNDVLISRSDGREGAIAYDPDRDEGDPFNELTDGQVYPDQPIPADDKMYGGDGADVFYFQTLINAKQRFIQKHTNDDGSIEWHNVAGENDNLHDHWVDVIGNDVIMDFNREQGDSIVIEGHTTKIRSIVYRDSNHDGVIDKSIISIYSDQGSGGGAHNQDELGTITVYGDIITMADIETTAAPAYGIVVSYNDLEEAVRPIEVSADTGTIRGPGASSGASEIYLATDPAIFAVNSATHFDAEDRAHMVFDHDTVMQVAQGTVALRFSVSEFEGTMGLFSKDASGDGFGHMAAYISGAGDLTVRMQGAEGTWYFSADGAIERGQEYDLAISFGGEGLSIYLNGVRIAYDLDVTQGWLSNTEKLVVGALGWGSSPGTANSVWSHLNGEISDIAIYDTQLDADELYDDPTWDGFFSVNADSSDVTIRYDNSGALKILVDGAPQFVPVDARFVEMQDVTIRVRDIQLGNRRNEYIQGGDGADFIDGKAGNDNLWGRGNDDRLYGDLGNDTLGGEEGRDYLAGGDGADALYGGDQNDTLAGGTGHDTLVGEDGSDDFRGGVGDDHIYGQSWGEEGTAGNDRAFFDGNFADFEFETYSYWNSSRGANMTWLVVTDSADGGLDGYYEGADRLTDIDYLVFADQTVAVADLI